MSMRVLTNRPGRRARVLAPVALAAAAFLVPGCTSAQRDSQASSYLIIASLQAGSGAQPGELDGVLNSDVLTLVKKTINDEEVLVPTVFEDPGVATFTLGLRDPGTTTAPSVPSTNNFITVTRHHVRFIRSDGRNVEGVDVPYAFDGAATGTVNATGGTVSFSLVRIQAKGEAPLKALVNGGGSVVLSTIAEVTFYGTDQTGRAVSVTGRIGVNFADWGDPD